MATLCVACGGGRSGTWQDDGDGGVASDIFDTAPASGGRIATTTKALGGTTSVARGGTGVYSTGGYRNTGGYPSKGGRATGGFPSTGGGGYRNTDGYATGGYLSAGGRATGGTAGRTSAAGFAGSTVGSAGAAGAASCNPARAGAAPTAGAAGTTGLADWYVDARNGSDVWPGTKGQPLKTLSCAASAARANDTVNLLDGTWDPNVDAKLANTLTTSCGLDSGIAFAANVALRAVNPGAARITNGGYHGLCMNGGVIDGIRFDCSTGRPAVETREGTLEITGSSLHNCATFGLDVSGNAQVTLRPGNLTDYTEYPNHSFAIARDQSSLSIDGGMISYSALAIQVEGSAALLLRGVTLVAQDPASMAGPAITMTAGSPRLTVEGGTTFENVVIGIYGYSASSEVNIDGMTFSHGSNAVMLTQIPNSIVPRVTVNHLNVVDNTSLGVSVAGKNALSVMNSSFIRCGAPSIMQSGSGTVTIDSVVITGGWGGILFPGDAAGDGLAVKVRNVEATGGQYAGVGIIGYASDSFDFGTVTSPGNNVFRGNNLIADSSSANFAFAVPAGIVVQAVGNTWDVNQQGADASGHYSVGPALGILEVGIGNGPNYRSGASNAGRLRLAENP